MNEEKVTLKCPKCGHSYVLTLGGLPVWDSECPECKTLMEEVEEKK